MVSSGRRGETQLSLPGDRDLKPVPTEDPITEAAALVENLVQDHPFLDGNKRAALVTADVHLRMDGLEPGGDSAHHRNLVQLMEWAKSKAIDR